MNRALCMCRTRVVDPIYIVVSEGKEEEEDKFIMINYKNVILNNHLKFLIDRTVV